MKIDAVFNFMAKDPITAAIVGGIFLYVIGTLLGNNEMKSFASIVLLIGFAMFVIRHRNK